MTRLQAVHVGLEGNVRVTPSEPLCEQVAATKVRYINVLCLCGFLVGLAAMFCSWTYLSAVDALRTSSLFSPDVLLSNSDLVPIGTALFLLGTALALITPLAGFIQAGGLFAFVVPVLDRASGITEYYGGTAELGPALGFYAGMVSAALVLASLVHPMGPGFGTARIDLRQRLFVSSSNRPLVIHGYRYRGPRLKQKSSRNLRASLQVLKGIMGTQKKWVAVLVTFMLVSVVLVLHDNGFMSDEPLLEEVGGGVSLLLFPVQEHIASGHWELFRLCVYDPQTHVSWRLQNSGLDGGAWSAISLGMMPLGSLNVSLTIIDRLGNGMADFGDRLVLTAQDGTAFEEDVVYRMDWQTNQTLGWSGLWEVSFVFHGDDLDSWVSQGIRYGL